MKTIDVDIDDSGNLYFKQDDDWVAMPQTKIPELIAILEHQARFLR